MVHSLHNIYAKSFSVGVILGNVLIHSEDVGLGVSSGGAPKLLRAPNKFRNNPEKLEVPFCVWPPVIIVWPFPGRLNVVVCTIWTTFLCWWGGLIFEFWLIFWVWLLSLLWVLMLLGLVFILLTEFVCDWLFPKIVWKIDNKFGWLFCKFPCVLLGGFKLFCWLELIFCWFV